MKSIGIIGKLGVIIIAIGIKIRIIYHKMPAYNKKN